MRVGSLITGHFESMSNVTDSYSANGYVKIRPVLKAQLASFHRVSLLRYDLTDIAHIAFMRGCKIYVPRTLFSSTPAVSVITCLKTHTSPF